MTNQEKIWFQELSKEHEQDAKTFQKPNYRGMWDRLVDMYKESAHFVYELIQNADDAHATEAAFELSSDHLVFKHNGTRRFTISDPNNEEKDRGEGKLGDINSITSIGFSTKADGNKSAPGNSIGKFGIGFKSVFVYTETPQIFDSNVSFQIREKIIPELIEPTDSIDPRWKTIFVIPFNNPAKTKEKAHEEISLQLKDMHNPTLFLNSLEKISYQFIENKVAMDGYYQKVQKEFKKYQDSEDTIAELLSLENYCNGQRQSDLLWTFSRKLDDGLKIAVGFYMADGKLITKQEPAYCFFQTKEDTHLNFIVHAPFLLTPDRQHLKDGENHNKAMLNSLANLAADSFVYLRNIGIEKGKLLIDDDILSLVPTQKNDFCNIRYEYSYILGTYKNKIIAEKNFYPFYQKIAEKFSSAELFPAGEKYVDAKHAYWAEDTSLVNLFSNEDLSAISSNEDACWVLLSKPKNGADEMHRDWMSDILDNSHLLSEDYFLQKISACFCENKFKSKPEWFVDFYDWLDSAKKRTEAAKSKSFFIEETGEASPAYINNVLQIFFPVDGISEYPTIHGSLYNNESIRHFLQKIGLTEPSLKDEIYTKIFPRYKQDEIENDIIKSDFKKILKYYKELSIGSIDEFLKDVKENILFVCGTLENEEKCLCFSKEIYLKTNELVRWFENAPQTKFLDIDFYRECTNESDELEKFFLRLGIFNEPKMVLKPISGHGNNSLKSQFLLLGISEDSFNNSYKRFLNQKIRSYEFNIDVVDNSISLMQSQNPDKSKLMWEFLKNNWQKYTTVKSICIKLTNAQYYQHDIFYEINATKLNFQIYSWLLKKDGEWKNTESIYVEDLADIYDTTSNEGKQLVQYLGIKNRPTAVMPQPVYDIETQKKIDFYDKLKNAGLENVSEDEIISILQERRRNLEQAKLIVQETPNLDKTNKKTEHKQKVVQEIVSRSESLSQESVIENDEVDDPADDFDDYTPKSVDFDKKIQKAKDRSAAELNTIEKMLYLQDVASKSNIYTFAWFKALLEMEASASFDNNSNSRQVNISFGKVEKSGNGHLILKHPNHYIPQHIEDLANIPVDLECSDGTKIRVVFEAMSVKSFDLYVKLRNPEEIKNLDVCDVVYVNINAQSPAFLYQELLNKFKTLKDCNGVGFSNDFDMKQNLTENIKFVFGPPGTGKTTYLAKDVLIPLMKESKKVLVLTPTNKAADVLTCRIAEQFSNGDDSYKKWLMRFGISCEERVEEYGITQGKEFDIENISKAVVVTTVARFAYDNFIKGEYLDNLAWDYIVIDEASMIPLVNIIYPLYKSNAQFVIAGDPFQIEPISSIDQWKDQNIYKMVGLSDFTDIKTEPHDYEVVKLNTQYRSIPSVGEVFSKLTYGGMLKHHRLESSQRLLNIGEDISLKPLNVIKFPVSKYEGIYRCKKLNNSHYQIYSALFTYEFVNHLSNLIAKKNPTESFTIGIIAAYRPQANMVERLFAAANLPSNIKVHAGTIHGFQGDECDIIVALFNPPENISKSDNMFLNKKNIVNVAISRARDYLIVVMPDNNTEKIENLELINSLEKLMAKGNYTEFLSNDLEEKLFEDREFLAKNTFVTTHQNVNVYGDPQYRYEIRSEENALDVQIHK